ncbi:MAG: PIG-L family deacetylase [Candidatus Aenigmarchaeota archaeon]|nr:PIG-L family deacetylase [Candidatus Aenigmarchaeota archaeon]
MPEKYHVKLLILALSISIAINLVSASHWIYITSAEILAGPPNSTLDVEHIVDNNFHLDYSNSTCVNTHFYIVAHIDDDFTFLNPDEAIDLQKTNDNIVIMYLTAGDKGSVYPDPATSKFFWQSRELGGQKVIETLLTEANKSWTKINVTSIIDVGGANKTLYNIRYTSGKRNIYVYYFRLPDGFPNGCGRINNGFNSLQKLYIGGNNSIDRCSSTGTYSINTVKSCDPERPNEYCTTWKKEELTTAITSILNYNSAPQACDNIVNIPHPFEDECWAPNNKPYAHADHEYTGKFAFDAYNNFYKNHNNTHYAAYRTDTLAFVQRNVTKRQRDADYLLFWNVYAPEVLKNWPKYVDDEEYKSSGRIFETFYLKQWKAVDTVSCNALPYPNLENNPVSK